MRNIYFIFYGIVSLLLLTNCGTYHQVSVERDVFYNNAEIPEKIDDYSIYIHDGQWVYRLTDATFKNDTIKGILDSISPTTVNAHPEKRSELKQAKNDLHIYLAKTTKELKAVKNPSSKLKSVAIDRNAVQRVDMFAKDEQSAWKYFGLFVGLIIVSVLALVALIYATAKASADAANNNNSGSGDSNSGDSGSGDSNSGGSNSNSDGSDSGGSDSGGSGSGCYVATMVYGSYDAPNVLVLRSFRDHFLTRFSPGRAFIKWYYKHSPNFVSNNKHRILLHRIIRGILNLFVWLIQPAFKKFM